MKQLRNMDMSVILMGYYVRNTYEEHYHANEGSGIYIPLVRGFNEVMMMMGCLDGHR